MNRLSANHVFSTVTINRIVDVYAYANGATAETRILGVPCMTQNGSDGRIASQRRLTRYELELLRR